MTFIHEFQHPRVVVHYNPVDGNTHSTDEFTQALSYEPHAIEVDLQIVDGQVIAGEEDSATLSEVIDRILAHKGASATVNNDGFQFFLVLDLKSQSRALFDGVLRTLARYRDVLSTAVNRTDGPRGITAVVTGVGDALYEYAKATQDPLHVNELCIAEGHDYSGEIENLSNHGTPFQWVAQEHTSERGHINPLHLSRDEGYCGGSFNLRVWGAEDDEEDQRLALASAADSVNAHPPAVEQLIEIIGYSQNPRGTSPSLAVRGSQAVLAWRGSSSNDLYVSLGTFTRAGLRLPRQVNMSYFLRETPQVIAPSIALAPDGRIVVVYEGTGDQKLWYVSGHWTSADRFLCFEGRENLLSVFDSRRGSDPSIAIGDDGRVIVVYEGTDNSRLWYVSGELDDTNHITGTEYSLTIGDARRGHTPSVAIDSDGKVIVAYRGTDDEKLWYVSGVLANNGQIDGDEFELTEGDARRGYNPCLRIGPDERVVVVYEGTADQRLWYVSGFRDGTGQIQGPEFELTEGDARRGSHPTIAFSESDHAAVLYTGTSDDKFWYVEGLHEASGQLEGAEEQLTMGFDRR